VIYRFGDLIPIVDVSQKMENGQWVRAVSEPFRGGLFDRVRDALAVLRGGDIFAVRWPRPGEFEEAMSREWRRSRSKKERN